MQYINITQLLKQSTQQQSVVKISDTEFVDTSNQYLYTIIDDGQKTIELTQTPDLLYKIINDSVLYRNQVYSVNRIATHVQTNLRVIEINKINTLQNGLFKNFQQLQRVCLNQVYNVGSELFMGCTALLYVQLSETISELPQSMFEGCTLLSTVNIPQNITRINDKVFKDCSSLNIQPTQQFVYIGNYAFQNCTTQQTLVQFSETLQYIGISAFENCVSMSGNLNISPQQLSQCSFKNCSSISSIVLCCGTRILTETFYGCVGVQQLILPSTLTTLDDKCFYQVGKNQNLSLDLQYITTLNGSSHFEESGVTGVQFGQYLTSTSNNMFKNSKLNGNLNLNKINTLGEYAFYGTNIVSTNSSLVSIFVQSSCFESCRFLQAINDSAVLVGLQSHNSQFKNCQSLNYVILVETMLSISPFCFQNCTSLQQIHIGFISTIGESTFEGCQNLVTVTLSDQIMSFGKRSFYGCSKLTSNIVVSSFQQLIGEESFRGCASIQQVLISTNNVNKYAFAECTGIKNIIYQSTNVPEGCFYGSTCEQMQLTNQSVTLRTRSLYFATKPEQTTITFTGSITNIVDVSGSQNGSVKLVNVDGSDVVQLFNRSQVYNLNTNFKTSTAFVLSEYFFLLDSPRTQLINNVTFQNKPRSGKILIESMDTNKLLVRSGDEGVALSVNYSESSWTNERHYLSWSTIRNIFKFGTAELDQDYYFPFAKWYLWSDPATRVFSAQNTVTMLTDIEPLQKYLVIDTKNRLTSMFYHATESERFWLHKNCTGVATFSNQDKATLYIYESQ